MKYCAINLMLYFKKKKTDLNDFMQSDTNGAGRVMCQCLGVKKTNKFSIS